MRSTVPTVPTVPTTVPERSVSVRVPPLRSRRNGTLTLTLSESTTVPFLGRRAGGSFRPESSTRLAVRPNRESHTYESSAGIDGTDRLLADRFIGSNRTESFCFSENAIGYATRCSEVA